MTRGLTAEMALLLACCRWPAQPPAVRDAAAVAIDWPRFAVLTRRHRVQGLVHHGLRAACIAVPSEVAATLAEEARRLATDNLLLAAESARVVRAVEEAGAPAMVVKGTPLAMIAYGTLAVKMAWDIDLLVPSDALDAAANALADAGYVCEQPGPDRGGLAAWHRFSKESVWRHSARGIHVELHTALVDSLLVLTGVGVRGPRCEVAIASGIALPTLPRDELFAYLCVHGATSGWRRAKWLADLAALIGGASGAELARLYDRSQALGSGRAAAQALLLCERYLGVALPGTLRARLRGDPIARAMTWTAGRIMTRADGYDDPAETAIGTLPVHLMYLVLLPGWRFPLIEVRRKFAPDPRLAPELGRAGRLLYPLTALVRRVRRRPLPLDRDQAA